ncbi:hypothetical protein ABMA28_008744 [Loxostege sticticalis]|uniref:Uncharacterized protein n=1 Tax=Loxostege sticticalis TaxID=481309 RepID=A0ABD0SEI4_LOXSC
MRLHVVLLFLVYTEGKKKSKENDDLVAPKIDVFPAPFPVPVPFGHIFKDGVGDMPDQKQPLDLLELDLHTPESPAEQEKLLRKVPKTNRLRVIQEPLGYANPRDQYQGFNIWNAEENAEEGVTPSTNTTDDRPKWFHFEAILEHNVKTPRPPVAIQAKKAESPDTKPENASTTDIEELSKDGVRAGYFSSGGFALYKDPETKMVYDYWTTCDQFEKKTRSFHPKDIVDIDWVPFYVWTTRKFAVSIVHRFSYPTKKTVKEYKEAYGPYLNVSVDWESPKLLLKEEVEMLLLAVDRNGLYHGIPRVKMPFNMKFDKNIRLPVITLRIKIEDPYLALMYCEEYYATIMAAPGAEPETDEEKKAEAAVINFKGKGFPISRDLYLEELERKGKAQREKESEETRNIKILHTNFDIERE